MSQRQTESRLARTMKLPPKLGPTFTAELDERNLQWRLLPGGEKLSHVAERRRILAVPFFLDDNNSPKVFLDEHIHPT